MKYLNFMRIAPLAIGLTVLVSACSTQDVYEPTPDPGIEEPEKPTEPSVNINWATNTTTTLSVDVNDEYNGKYYYTVEAYVGNPMVDANAKLISGSGQKTNSKLSYSREIVVPVGESVIYIAVKDPFERRRIYTREVQKGSISLTIGENNIPTRSDIATKSELNSTPTPEINFNYEGTPIELEGSTNITFTPGETYVVKAGKTFSGKIGFSSGNVKLYVEGTLLWDDVKTVQDKCEIYVKKGGVLKAKTSKNNFEFVKGTLLAVEEGGILGDETQKVSFGLFRMTDESVFVNYGSVYASNFLMTSKAKTYNEGLMEIDAFETRDNTNPFVNNSTVKANNIVLTNGYLENNNQVDVATRFYMNGGTIVNTHTITTNKIEWVKGKVTNSCLIEAATRMDTNGTTIEQLTAAYFYAKDAELKGTTLNMDDSAIFDTETLKFSGGAGVVKGTGTGYALLRASTSITLGYASATSYDGMLEIDYNKQNGGTHSKITNVKGNAAFADGQASVEIQPSECNKNTGNTNKAEGPADIDETYEDGETLPYTYLFEDNWPAKGDYDMNDLVMSVELRNTVKGAKTERVQVIATLYAAGGTKVLAAGYQLDGVRASAVSDGEDGQDYAVFHLFSDAHEELGAAERIPTNTYKIDHPTQTIEQEVIFTTPIDGVINANNFNLFLVLGGNFDQDTRNEVHLPGFKGTNKAATSEFSTDDYIDIETGWMWGLAIPQTVFGTYPKEGTPIMDAYEGFDAWVTGNDTPDWYNNYVENKVIIFEEPSEEEI